VAQKVFSVRRGFASSPVRVRTIYAAVRVISRVLQVRDIVSQLFSRHERVRVVLFAAAPVGRRLDQGDAGAQLVGNLTVFALALGFERNGFAFKVVDVVAAADAAA